jgi:hypothetical protein
MAERVLVLGTAAAVAGLWALSEALDRRIAWDALGLSLGFGGVWMAVGVCLRMLTRLDRLPALLVASSFFLCFTLAVTSCAYLRFPFPEGTIDPLLMRIDALLGYDWTEAAHALAAWPGAGPLLAPLYLSSLPQLLFLAVLLAALGRVVELHRLALCGGIAVVLTVAIWCAAPSLGPASILSVPSEIEETLALVVDSAFGAELRHLASNGVEVIHPGEITGVIAFPSYHMVMALMVWWYSRGTWAVAPAAALGLAMIPATLVHGGHHLVDLAGGAAVFALAAALAARIAPHRAPPNLPG